MNEGIIYRLACLRVSASERLEQVRLAGLVDKDNGSCTRVELEVASSDPLDRGRFTPGKEYLLVVSEAPGPE